MVKARCYAKFLSPSFGGSAASFSGNYGFYAEIPGLMAKAAKNVGGSSHLDKRGPKKKLSRGVSVNWKTDEIAVACQAMDFKGSQMT